MREVGARRSPNTSRAIRASVRRWSTTSLSWLASAVRTRERWRDSLPSSGLWMVLSVGRARRRWQFAAWLP